MGWDKIGCVVLYVMYLSKAGRKPKSPVCEMGSPQPIHLPRWRGGEGGSCEGGVRG